MEKLKSIRPRLRSRGRSLEIRCRANLLPFKSIKYALQHAKLKLHGTRKSNANLYVQKLQSKLKELDGTMDSFRDSVDIDPDRHSGELKSALDLYVELFYCISREERRQYINSFNATRYGGIIPQRNLLIIPALMAELNEPEQELSRALFCKLYCMPFKVLHESSKSALHVGILEQNMAIISVPYKNVERFSNSMSRLESRIKTIDEGSINPHEDEDLKADFIEKAAEFSNDTKIDIMDLISERVGTQSAMLSRMHRIIRRPRHL